MGHIRLANRNHETLIHLLSDGDAHLEWVVTIAFYKALHVVEAVFDAEMQKHSMSHNDRNQTLRVNRFKAVHKPYSKLYRASRIARYLEDDSGGRFASFADYMDAETVRDKVIMKELRSVEQNCLQFLGDEAKRELIKIDQSMLPDRVDDE